MDPGSLVAFSLLSKRGTGLTCISGSDARRLRSNDSDWQGPTSNKVIKTRMSGPPGVEKNVPEEMIEEWKNNQANYRHALLYLGPETSSYSVQKRPTSQDGGTSRNLKDGQQQ